MQKNTNQYPLYTKVAAILFIVLILYGQFYLLSALGFIKIPALISDSIGVVVLLAILFASIHIVASLYQAFFHKHET